MLAGMLRPATRDRFGLPDTRGRGRLLVAAVVDATGSGLFLPFTVVYFLRTTDLAVPTVGAALTVAALLALPAPAAIGPLVDRFGPVRLVAAGNVLSAVGFTGYLFTGPAWSVTLAATAVNLGSTTFWTANGSLVALAARPAERARWFGLIRALRNAGIGVGGLLAALALGTDGQSALHLLAAGDAVSYLAAAGLIFGWTPRRAPHPDHGAGRDRGYRQVLADRPYLALVCVHVAFVLAGEVLTVLLAVYITRALHGPAWLAGAMFTTNTALVAATQTAVARHLERHRRTSALVLAALLNVTSFAGFAALLDAGHGWRVVVGLVAAVVVLTAAEVIESPAIADLVTNAAPDRLRGRYLAVNQFSWAIGGAAAPLLFTALLARGPLWPWLFLIAVSLMAAAVLPGIGNRLPAAANHPHRSCPQNDHSGSSDPRSGVTPSPTAARQDRML
jgi:MFS family permease